MDLMKVSPLFIRMRLSFGVGLSIVYQLQLLTDILYNYCINYVFTVSCHCHMRKRSWTKAQLRKAVRESASYRQVLFKLKLREAGGNYQQLKKYIAEEKLDTKHFKGRGWNLGLKGIGKNRIPLEKILRNEIPMQSYKLKKRLIKKGLLQARCEKCNWAEVAPDGSVPVELDHINGDNNDNRLENLRILCPNCHSLTKNYRGRKSHNRPGGGIGRRATLKML